MPIAHFSWSVPKCLILSPVWSIPNLAKTLLPASWGTVPCFRVQDNEEQVHLPLHPRRGDPQRLHQCYLRERGCVVRHWGKENLRVKRNVNKCRARNSLIWFPSVSLVFCPKMSEWASDSLKKMSDLLIRSFLVSEMNDLLIQLISSVRPEQIAHGRSFLVSDLLTSLIWFERNEWFTHIAHKKRGNEQKWVICSFLGFFFKPLQR